MDDEDLSVGSNLDVEAMIIDALALLDPKGTNPYVTESMYVVRKAFQSAERGERVTGFEIVQQAKWQLGVEN